MATVAHAKAFSSERHVELHRIALEERDRTGVTALVEGDIPKALRNFQLAERHCYSLSRLLRDTDAIDAVMKGSLEMSNRVANIRSLNNGNGKETGAAVLMLIARRKH